MKFGMSPLKACFFSHELLVKSVKNKFLEEFLMKLLEIFAKEGLKFLEKTFKKFAKTESLKKLLEESHEEFMQ